MSDVKQILCDKCRRPRTADGSITQWISLCTCDSAPLSSTLNDSNLPPIDLCSKCGKRSSAGRAGSFTQWILRSDTCTCAMPEFASSIEAAAGTAAAGHSGVVETAAPSGTRADEEELNLPPDMFPLERYKPVELIGQGAAGTVYRCRDRLLGKWVAIKCLRAITPEQLVSFQNEAKATSLLNHPGVVAVMDFGSTAGGAPFMVMEYVRGPSIKALLESNGPSSETIAIPIFIRIAEALAHAHSKNVFHRDLKSSNIVLVNNDGRDPDVRIIDFGIATVKQITQEPTIHQGKTVAGTPHYMSPDQARGLAFDERSEVYNFGCVMFEMLTGRTPFTGETPIEIIGKHANAVPPKLADVAPDQEFSDAIEALICKCLEKEPAKRFQTMNELIEALKTIGSSTDGEPTVENADRFKKLALGAVAVACALLLTGFVGIQLKSANDQREAAEAKTLARKEEAARVQKAARQIDKVWIRRASNEYWQPIGAITDDDLVALQRYRSQEAKAIWFFSNTIDGLLASVTKRGWQALARMPLTRLHFQNVGLNDSALRYVAKIKTLKTLMFNEEPITDRGVEFLAVAPSIEALVFDGALVTDKSAGSFCRMRNLNSLTLMNTRFTDAGVDALKDTNIRSLNIGSTLVTDACLDSVAQMKHLEHLRIGRTKITGKGLLKLTKLPLNVLTINELSGVTDDTIELIAQNYPGMYELNMDGVSLGTKGWSNLAKLKELEHLSIMGTNVDDATFTPISTLPRLTSITVAGTAISDKSFARLANMPNLKTVEAGQCRNVTKSGLKLLELNGVMCSDGLPEFDGTSMMQEILGGKDE